MKKILFVAIMAGAMFACNKQDEITGPEVNTGENTVTLTVKQAAQTRGRFILSMLREIIFTSGN